MEILGAVRVTNTQRLNPEYEEDEEDGGKEEVKPEALKANKKHHEYQRRSCFFPTFLAADKGLFPLLTRIWHNAGVLGFEYQWCSTRYLDEFRQDLAIPRNEWKGRIIGQQTNKYLRERAPQGSFSNV
jgi:hypothetical protein